MGHVGARFHVSRQKEKTSIRNLSVFVLLAELMGRKDSLGGQPAHLFLNRHCWLECSFSLLSPHLRTPRPGVMYSRLSQKNTTPHHCMHPNLLEDSPLHLLGPACLWALLSTGHSPLSPSHPVCTAHSTELLKGTDSTCHILFQRD